MARLALCPMVTDGQRGPYTSMRSSRAKFMV